MPEEEMLILANASAFYLAGALCSLAWHINDERYRSFRHLVSLSACAGFLSVFVIALCFRFDRNIVLSLWPGVAVAFGVGTFGHATKRLIEKNLEVLFRAAVIAGAKRFGFELELDPQQEPHHDDTEASDDDATADR